MPVSLRRARAAPSNPPVWTFEMMRMLLISVVALVPMLSGCPIPQDQNVPNPAPLIFEPTTGRAYKLYVSSKVDPSIPAPLIISLHGTAPWDTAAMQANEWKKIAEDSGAILVCPTLQSSDGIFPAGDDGLIERTLKDERFVLIVLAEMHRRFNIDRRNVYLTSWSGGGYPLYFIGLRHPDLFAALCARQSTFRAAGVDGWFPPEARTMPILIFYGTSDVAPVIEQSKQAYDYLNLQGFRHVRLTTVQGGHARHPDVAMEFFREHWRYGPYKSAPRSPLLALPDRGVLATTASD